MVYGKVPPQVKDLENYVLGALMMDREAIDVIQEFLSPECFYTEANQMVFRAICSLAERNITIEVLSVVEELKKRGELDKVGGVFAITKLTNPYSHSGNLATYSKIILEKYMARELIRIGGEMVTEGYSDEIDVFELLNQSEADITAISTSLIKKDFTGIESGLYNVVTRIEELRHKEHALTGVPTGFKQLDKVTNGWQSTDLIILAARPSVGKTAFALNLIRNAVFDKFKPTPVGVFSLEMSKEQLIERLLSSESEIHLERIKHARINDEQMKHLYTTGVDKLSRAPIFIDDTAGINIIELRSKARRMKKKQKVGMIIIDYLQLMSGAPGNKGNREQEVSQISRELKKLAKDLEIPVIALSQLSRGVENRADRTPKLSDLRESGSIEQDADMVMFLYKPTKEEEEADAELSGLGYLNIAKHRSGDLSDLVFKFYGHIQKWMEVDKAAKFESSGNWKPIPPPKSPANNFYETDRNDDDMPF